MSKKLLKKIFSTVAAFSLLVNSFSAPLAVYAQEATSEPTPTTVEETPTPTPTLTATPTPDEIQETGTIEAITTTEEEVTEPAPSPYPEPDLTEAQEEETSAQLVPSISTDQADYSPTGTVLITGQDFSPNTEYTIEITSDTGNFKFSDTVTSDESGGLFYSYQLDGTYRPLYKVEIKDGDTVVASTTFTDSGEQFSLEQWSDEDVDLENPEPGTPEWQSGSLNPGNSEYQESESVPFRLTIDNADTTINYTLRIKYDFQAGTIRGYDYLTSYNLNRSPTVPAGPADDTESIPADGTFGFSQIAGNFTLWGGAFVGTPSGPSVDGNAKYYELTIDPSSSTVYLLWGGHLASPIDWGVGNGASSYTGASLHMHFGLMPGDTGSKDRSIQTNAIVPLQGTITVYKEIVPPGSSLWDFSLSGPDSFSANANGLGDGDSYTFTDLAAGTYNLSEITDENYSTAVSCGSEGSGSDNVDITLDAGENVICTFTNTLKTGSITLTKSSDNQIDPLDWTFDVDGPGTSVFSGVTSGTPLTNLPLGTYTITETGPLNYHFVSGSGTGCSFGEEGTLTVDITDNGQSYSCTFVNAPDNGSISGHKYHDKNANGQYDAGDSVLPDWTINLSGNATDSTTTDSNGEYTFPGLLPGSYTVCETLESGWTQVAPDPDTNNGCYDVAVGPGQGIANRDFFNFKNIKISGYKFEDLNGDGDWDQGEPGLENWTINLGGSKTDSITTDGNGYYEFTDLGPGDYTVYETLLSFDWLRTAGDNPYEITAVGGQDESDINFGNFKYATVWGYKYNDLDADGDILDDVELLEGWEINLTGQTSILTDGSGYYEFTGLLAGDYTLSETLQPGWTNSYPSGDYQFTIQSGDFLQFDFANWTKGALVVCKYDENQEPVSGWEMRTGGLIQDTEENGCTTFELDPGTYTVTEENNSSWVHTNPESGEIGGVVVTSNHETGPINFYNARKGSLTIEKFNDLNGNGADDDEPRLEDWHFTVYEGTCEEETGTDILSGNTDSSGQLSGLLPAGNYCAVEDDSSHTGWEPTTPTEVDFTVFPNGQETILFGNFELITISGYKFHDVNNNGSWDDGEPGLADWTINLDEDSTTTDGNGYYEFSPVGQGTYTLFEDLETGWVQTYPESGDYEITTESGQDRDDLNFGNFLPEPELTTTKVRSDSTPDTILVGENAVMEITIENTGNVTLYNVIAFDLFDTDYVDFVSSSPQSPDEYYEVLFVDTGDYDSDGDTSERVGGLAWDLGDLDPGETVTLFVTFVATATTPEPDVLAWNGAASFYCLDEEEESCVEPEELSYANVDIDSVGITIEKSNDKSGGASLGDTVTYTLIITNTGDTNFSSIEVKDVLPGGFSYAIGSTEVNGSPFFDPIISGGQLVWIIDEPEFPIILTYRATIAGDLTPATYVNYATCLGFLREQETECNVAQSSVAIGQVFSYGGQLTPQVLGAATELPATGSKTSLLLFALIVGGFGIFTKVKASRLGRRKYAKN